MIITALMEIFKRDLEKLRMEISQYSNEKIIWRTDKNIRNAAGNLCLHLIGNLNAYIGGALGKTNYVRDREAEFSTKDASQAFLLQRIDETIKVVEQSMQDLDDERLGDDFPVVIWDRPTSLGYTLIHLTTHLNYHLGQINYHRRLLDSQVTPDD